MYVLTIDGSAGEHAVHAVGTLSAHMAPVFNSPVKEVEVTVTGGVGVKLHGDGRQVTPVPV